MTQKHNLLTPSEIKKKVGNNAAALIKDGMCVGLGTGSTSGPFIDSLIQRCKEGLKISAIASSKASEERARKGGIPLLDSNNVTSLDITVDGADEIDSQKRMIKGGGGALLREKILASCSKEMIVVVDETKLVAQLGATKLPVEIIPFGHLATIFKLKQRGYEGKLRMTPSETPYITDNSNFIFDIHFKELRKNPEADALNIQNIPGVVETGFFLGLAGRVIIGFNDGRIEILP